MYGAEESDEYEFERSYDGSLGPCLDKLKEYQRIIDSNALDAYLGLEPWDGGRSFEGDIYNIFDDLLDSGYKTQDIYI